MLGRIDPCGYYTNLSPPPGYSLSKLGEIAENYSVRSFQFVSDSTVYALASNGRGGYAEVLKSVDGGRVWTDLELIDKDSENGMAFLNEDIGVVSV